MRWAYADQDHLLGLIVADNTGTFTIPNGHPCAGTRLYMSGPGIHLVLTRRSGNGLATMHGSSFTGDCAKALIDLDGVMKETLGKPIQR